MMINFCFSFTVIFLAQVVEIYLQVLKMQSLQRYLWVLIWHQRTVFAVIYTAEFYNVTQKNKFNFIKNKTQLIIHISSHRQTLILGLSSPSSTQDMILWELTIATKCWTYKTAYNWISWKTSPTQFKFCTQIWWSQCPLSHLLNKITKWSH